MQLERVFLKIDLGAQNAVIRGEDGLPTAIRLLTRGVNSSTKGDLTFDDSSAAAISAQAAEWGNQWFFDYDHAIMDSKNTAPDKAIAAGWYDLEIKEDGLWAVGIEWVPRAQQYLTNKEFKYFSPAFWFDKVTRVFSGYINTALTNYPALNNLEPLVLNNLENPEKPEVSTKPRTPSAADYRVGANSITFDQIANGVHELLEERFPDCWIVEIYNDYAVFRFARTLWSVSYSIENDKPILTGDAVEVQKVYLPVTGGTTMKTTLTALGLKSDASEDQATERAVGLTALEREVLALTGKASLDEAKGVLAAFKSSHEQNVTLSAKVAELEGEKQSTRLNALIEKGKADKKLSPALETWAKTQTFETLSAFLEAQMPIAILETPPREPEVNANGEIAAVTLNGKAWEHMLPMEKHNLKESNATMYEALRSDYVRRGSPPIKPQT